MWHTPVHNRTLTDTQESRPHKDPDMHLVEQTTNKEACDSLMWLRAQLQPLHTDRSQNVRVCVVCVWCMCVCVCVCVCVVYVWGIRDAAVLLICFQTRTVSLSENSVEELVDGQNTNYGEVNQRKWFNVELGSSVCLCLIPCESVLCNNPVEEPAEVPIKRMTDNNLPLFSQLPLLPPAPLQQNNFFHSFFLSFFLSLFLSVFLSIFQPMHYPLAHSQETKALNFFSLASF